MRLDEFRRPRAYNCYRFLRTLGWSRGRALRWIVSEIEAAAWRRKELL